MGCCKDDIKVTNLQYQEKEVVSPQEALNTSDPNIGCCGGIDDDFSYRKDPWWQHSQKFWSENPVPMKVQLVDPDAKVPEKAHTTGDIAWDIRCVEDEEWDNCILFAKSEPCFELMPYESHTFSTGIKVAVPHNYGFLLRERSGLGISDISVGAGVIEGTYRGEWKIHLRNMSKKPKMFKVGDKIAQAVLIPIIPALPEVVEHLPESERGDKGFGSSGR